MIRPARETKRTRREPFSTTRSQATAWFLHPLFLGGYSDELNAYLEKNDLVPRMEEGDFDVMHQKLDFYGLNFYNGLYDNMEESERERRY
ncbi:MAG: family 1 glycosylhydrolase [Blautia sp.]